MEQAAPRPARSRFHTICHNPGEKESPAFLCHPHPCRQAERCTHGRALLRESPGEAGIARKGPRPLLCATCKEARLCAEGCGWQRDYQPGLDETGTDSKGVPSAASSPMRDTSLLGHPSPQKPLHWPYPEGHPQPGTHPPGCFHGYMAPWRSWPCKLGDLDVSGHVAVPRWLAEGGSSSSGSREASGRERWAGSETALPSTSSHPPPKLSLRGEAVASHWSPFSPGCRWPPGGLWSGRIQEWNAECMGRALAGGRAVGHALPLMSTRR